VSGQSLPGLVLGGEPRVQLLPSVVKEREKSRALRRRLALLLVLAMVVTGAGIAWAYFQKTQAEMDLQAANNETVAILAQQAQYADASQLANLLNRAAEAERTVTSTEVLWASAYAAIREHIPDGIRLTGYEFKAPAPWEQPLLPEGPLREERVAELTLEFSGDGYAPVWRFIESIASIHAFSDVKFDSTTFDDGTYTSVVSLTFDAGALSGRFATDSGDEREEAEQ